MKLGRLVIAVAWLAGCAGESGNGPTGGAGGQAGSGGSGGSGGTGGMNADLPAYATTVAKGKIAGKLFEFVTGFVRQTENETMNIELLGFSPELNGPCWNQPPPDSNRDLQLRVVFRVPRTGGSFVWGSGQTIGGYSAITLTSIKDDGTTQNTPTDKAKVMIGAWPTGSGKLDGSVVVQMDASNSINGTFSIFRCD